MKQDTSLDLHTLREMESLLTKLKSRYVGERKEAEQRLQAMGASAVEPLLSLITRENQLRIKHRRMYIENKRAVGGLALAVGMPSTFAPDLRYGVASALQNLTECVIHEICRSMYGVGVLCLNYRWRRYVRCHG